MPFRLPNCWLSTMAENPDRAKYTMDSQSLLHPAFRRPFCRVRGSGSLSSVMLLPLLCSLFVGCSGAGPATGDSDKADEPKRLSVAVTSGPLFVMASAVAGELADVRNVIPAGEISRNWKPVPEAIATMQSSDLILISGAGYEPWKSRVSLPNSRVVDTAAGYYDHFVRIPDAVMHQHGPEGSHSHPGTVWATWLDPQLAISQLDRVTDAFAKREPQSAAEFRQNAVAIRQRLAQLDQRLSEIVADSEQLEFRFAGDGPYYQYLTERFGRPLKYLHWPEPEVELSDEQRAECLQFCEDGPPVIFLIRSETPASRLNFVQNAVAGVVSVDLTEEIAETTDEWCQRLQTNVEGLAAAIDQLSVATTN
jgi:zinc transport system substrate-binding protein